MAKSLFEYNRLLKPICEKITGHRHCRLLSCTQSFIDNGYKNPEQNDFYYKCKICGYLFFNHSISDKDIAKIKEWERKSIGL